MSCITSTCVGHHIGAQILISIPCLHAHELFLLKCNTVSIRNFQAGEQANYNTEVNGRQESKIVLSIPRESGGMFSQEKGWYLRPL